MTLPPEWIPGLRAATLLGLEIAAVACIAAVLERRTRSVFWHRLIWQAATVGIALLCCLELSGLSSHIRQRAGNLISAWSPRPLPMAVSESAALLSSSDEPKLTAEFRGEVAARLAANRRDDANVSSAPVARRQLQVLEERWLDEPWLQGQSLPWPELVWFIGTSAALGVIVLGRVVLFYFLGAKRPQIFDEALRQRVASIARRMGISERIGVFESHRLRGPIALGVIRPTVGLPKDFTRSFSSDQQEVILAHELAHLAGRDPAWQLLADLTVSVLWWHPVAWWARHRLRAAAESVADEASLVVAGGPGILAECLLQFASRVAQRQPVGWLGATGPGFRSGLGRRVERLVNLGGSWSPLRKIQSRTVSWAVPVALVFGVIACTAWTGPKQREGMHTITQTWKRSITTLAMFTAVFGRAEAPLTDPVAAPPRQSSPAGSAPADTTAAPKDTLVQDARLLLEMGRLDEAERKLRQAVRRHPIDPLAARYLALAQEAQAKAAEDQPAAPETLPEAVEAIKRSWDPVADPDAFSARYGVQTPVPAGQVNNWNAIPPGSEFTEAEAEPAAEVEPAPELRPDPRLMERYGLKPLSNPILPAQRTRSRPNRGKQQVEAKLNQIVLPEVVYDGIPLSDIIKDLSSEARKRDPARQGINFLLSNVPNNAPEIGAIDPTTGAPISTWGFGSRGGVDPVSGVPLPATNLDLANTPVRLHLRDVRLKDVLDALTRVADQPVRYTVEEYGVVFSPGSGLGFVPSPVTRVDPQPLPVQVRTFRVDTNSFLAGLESAFGIFLPTKIDPTELQSLEGKLQHLRDELAQKKIEAGRPNPKEATLREQEDLENQLRRFSHVLDEASQGRPDRARQVQRAVRQLLLQLGIDMEAPNKAVFFNDLTGILMVRATVEDLELVQAAVETLGGEVLSPRLRSAKQDAGIRF